MQKVKNIKIENKKNKIENGFRNIILKNISCSFWNILRSQTKDNKINEHAEYALCMYIFQF